MIFSNWSCGTGTERWSRGMMECKREMFIRWEFDWVFLDVVDSILEGIITRIYIYLSQWSDSGFPLLRRQCSTSQCIEWAVNSQYFPLKHTYWQLRACTTDARKERGVTWRDADQQHGDGLRFLINHLGYVIDAVSWLSKLLTFTWSIREHGAIIM